MASGTRTAPAIDCSTDKVLWATFTLGGLRTTPDSAVLRPDGQTIPGLFALGEGAGWSGGIVTSAADGIRLADRAKSRKAR